MPGKKIKSTRSEFIRMFFILGLIFGLFGSPATEATIGVLNGLTHEKVAVPGHVYEGTILVQNMSQETQMIKVYARDYHFYADGRKFYDEPGGLARSNASWITFLPDQTEIPPGETETIRYTVQVPNDSQLRGTYWSMLLVEPVPKIDPEDLTKNAENVNFAVRQVFRIAVQIITHIGDAGLREVKFINTQVLQSKDQRILQVDVENTGEQWLRPVLWVEMYDEQGAFQGKYGGQRWRIYPGTSVRYQVDLTPVPAGVFKVLVVLDNLDDYVFGAEHSLTLKGLSQIKNR